MSLDIRKMNRWPVAAAIGLLLGGLLQMGQGGGPPVSLLGLVTVTVGLFILGLIPPPVPPKTSG